MFDHGISRSPKHSPLRSTFYSVRFKDNGAMEEEDDDFLETSRNKATTALRKRRNMTPLREVVSQLPPPPSKNLPLTTFNEVDCKNNPYLEIPKKVNETKKVSFVDFRDGINVHEYSLQDEYGGYTQYLTSVSSMLDTWIEWNKQNTVEDDVPDVEPRLKRANDSLKASKNSVNGFRFHSSVPIITQIFTDYFNNFCDGQIVIPAGRTSLSFNERREYFLSLQETKTPKNVDQFFPSQVFSDFEEWFKAGCPTFTPFEDQSQALKLARYLYNCNYPQFEHIENQRLRHVFKAFLDDETFAPMTGFDIATSYTVARDAGTDLHNYLEFRLTDPATNSVDEAKLKYPLREKEDYVQAEHFVENIPFKFVHLELRLASFRHKICGSVDAISQLSDGTYVVHDHKRTPKFNSRPWFKPMGKKCPKMSDEPLSSELVKYAIQMAGYRKLLILNGTVEVPVKVSNIAYLHVFHPTLRQWALIEIDMSQKMRKDVKGAFRGIGVSLYGEDALTLSPIELVELLFQFYEQEMLTILRLKNR